LKASCDEPRKETRSGRACPFSSIILNHMGGWVVLELSTGSNAAILYSFHFGYCQTLTIFKANGYHQAKRGVSRVVRARYRTENKQ